MTVAATAACQILPSILVPPSLNASARPGGRQWRNGKIEAKPLIGGKSVPRPMACQKNRRAADRLAMYARPSSAALPVVEDRMTDQDAVLAANLEFYRAFAARDLAAMDALWALQAPVAC